MPNALCFAVLANDRSWPTPALAVQSSQMVTSGPGESYVSESGLGDRPDLRDSKPGLRPRWSGVEGYATAIGRGPAGDYDDGVNGAHPITDIAS